MAYTFNPFTGNFDYYEDAAPGGSTTQLQYNNAGVFGGAMIEYTEPSSQPLLSGASGKTLSISDNTGASSLSLSATLAYLQATGGDDFILLTGGIQIFSDTSLDLQTSTGLYRWFSGASVAGIFDFTGLTTSNKTYTWPNASGTVALTSDIPAGAGAWTDAGTFLYPTNTEDVILGGTTTGAADIWLKADGSAIFNQQSLDRDFQVNWDTGTAIFVDGTAGFVGIGEAAPVLRLHVTLGDSGSAIALASGQVALFQNDALTTDNSIIAITGGDTGAAQIHFGGTTNPIGAFISHANSTNIFSIDSDGAIKLQATAGSETVINESGADSDTRIEGDTATQLFVTDAGLDAVRIGTTSAGVLADFRSTGITFFEDGTARDFRVEGDTDINLLFTDGSADSVGIGTATPNAKLNIYQSGGALVLPAIGPGLILQKSNSTDVASAFIIGGSSAGTNTAILYIGSGANPIANFIGYDVANDEFRMQATKKIELQSGVGSSTVVNEDGADTDFRVETDADTGAILADGGANRVVIGDGENATLSIGQGKFNVELADNFVQGTLDTIATFTTDPPDNATLPTVGIDFYKNYTYTRTSGAAGTKYSADFLQQIQVESSGTGTITFVGLARGIDLFIDSLGGTGVTLGDYYFDFFSKNSSSKWDVYHTGAHRNRYNGVQAHTAGAAGAADTVVVAFAEALPDANYSVELTDGVSAFMVQDAMKVIVGTGFIHTHATIDRSTKATTGFTGYVTYEVVDNATGTTWAGSTWHNAGTMLTPGAGIAAHFAGGFLTLATDTDYNSTDWAVRRYY